MKYDDSILNNVFSLIYHPKTQRIAVTIISSKLKLICLFQWGVCCGSPSHRKVYKVIIIISDLARSALLLILQDRVCCKVYKEEES